AWACAVGIGARGDVGEGVTAFHLDHRLGRQLPGREQSLDDRAVVFDLVAQRRGPEPREEVRIGRVDDHLDRYRHGGPQLASTDSRISPAACWRTPGTAPHPGARSSLAE